MSLIISIPERELPCKLSELTGGLVDVCQEVQVYKWHPENELFNTHFTIKAKMNWTEQEERFRMRLSREQQKKLYPYTKHLDLCWQDGCFEEPAGTAFMEKYAMYLPDIEHISTHAIHSVCSRHLPLAYHRMVKTLEALELSQPGTKYWTRIVTWQKRKLYYGRLLWLEKDGDYETGYFDFINGIQEVIGPCPTREATIEAIQEKFPQECDV